MRKLLLLLLVLSTLPLIFCSCGDCEHEWSDGYVAKEATHEAEGYRIRTCLKCKEQMMEAIAKLPHTPNDHSYDKGRWGSDGVYHWLLCDYDECETATGKAPHAVVASPNGGYMCGVCRATTDDHIFLEDYEYDEKQHWHACQDEECPVISDRGTHLWQELDDMTLYCSTCSATKEKAQTQINGEE